MGEIVAAFFVLSLGVGLAVRGSACVAWNYGRVWDDRDFYFDTRGDAFLFRAAQRVFRRPQAQTQRGCDGVNVGNLRFLGEAEEVGSWRRIGFEDGGAVGGRTGGEVGPGLEVSGGLQSVGDAGREIKMMNDAAVGEEARRF